MKNSFLKRNLLQLCDTKVFECRGWTLRLPSVPLAESDSAAVMPYTRVTRREAGVRDPPRWLASPQMLEPPGARLSPACASPILCPRAGWTASRAPSSANRSPLPPWPRCTRSRGPCHVHAEGDPFVREFGRGAARRNVGGPGSTG